MGKPAEQPGLDLTAHHSEGVSALQPESRGGKGLCLEKTILCGAEQGLRLLGQLFVPHLMDLVQQNAGNQLLLGLVLAQLVHAAAQGCPQLLRVNGLEQIVLNTQMDGGFGILKIIVTAQLLHPAQKLQPVAAGHLDVCEHQADGVLGKQLKGLLPVLGQVDFAQGQAQAFNQLFQSHQHDGFILAD